MEALLPIALSALAVLGIVATIAGVESRDGFDRDGAGDPDGPAFVDLVHPTDRIH